MFKKTFAKTPHIDQAIKDEGITVNVTLTDTQVQNILYNAIQLKSSPPPEPADNASEKVDEKLAQVRDRLFKIWEKGAPGTEILDPSESKKIERVIKTEVSKSRQQAIDVGIQLIQLSATYAVDRLLKLWVEAYRTGLEWETLKETQNKVKLSET